MMEQGGNTLIGRLIQDLHCEHVAHEHAMDEFRTRLRLLGQCHPTDGMLRALTQGFDDLADELGSHIRAEDGQLFPLFAAPVPGAHAADVLRAALVQPG
jgi:regulator of cell morphogenesis and NO signaling